MLKIHQRIKQTKIPAPRDLRFYLGGRGRRDTENYKNYKNK